MGTDYFIICKKCKKKEYTFKRTLGKYHIPEATKTLDFLVEHVCNCGQKNIFVISEHDDGYLYDEDDVDDEEEA